MVKLKEKLITVSGASPYITISSDRSVLIESCTNILECNEILVRVRTSQFNIEVSGFDLKLDSYTNSSIEVSGIITGLALERRKAGGDL